MALCGNGGGDMKERVIPAALQPVLARVHNDAAQHFGIPSLRLIPLEYHEREFSHVLRLAVHQNGSSEPLTHLFVKVTKSKKINGGAVGLRARVVRDYETTCRAYDSMRLYKDLGVVPPVACYPEHLAIVTEEVTGPTLQRYLARRGAWFPSRQTMASLTDLLETTGRWIRVFQQSMPLGGTFDLGEVREYIDHRLKRLAEAPNVPFTQQNRMAVLQHIAALSAAIPPGDLCEVSVHSDLALGNILVDGTRVVVLDFGMTKTGCPLVDLTRLFVQMQLLAVKPQIRSVVIRSLQHALIKGYDSALSVADPLFRLYVLRHRINHLVTLRFDRNRGLSAAYSRVVCRDHERWLRRELRTGVGALAQR